MKVYLTTNIDIFKGQFPTNYTQPPMIGAMVKIINWHNNPMKLPFDELEVKHLTYDDANNVRVELHLSELQHKQMIEYNLKVYN